MTWEKNISVGQYSVRARLTYHLKRNDLNLSINPSIENTGNASINNDLAFVWKIKYIKIDNNNENDFVYINNSFYRLNQDNSLFFKNLSYQQFTENDTFLYKQYYPHFKLYDDKTGKYLTLDWNKNLNYNVTLKSEAGQYNSPLTLAIKVAGLNVGQKKSTMLYWIDAGEQFARPDQDINVNNWQVAPLYKKIDETAYDDSDYIDQVSNAATNLATNVSLSSMLDPQTSTGHKIRYRYAKDVSGGMTVDIQVRLFQGNTLIATDTKTNIGTTFTTATYTLTASEADSITSYSNLTLQLRKIGSFTIPRRKLRVSFVEFETPTAPLNNLTYDKNGNLVSAFQLYYEYNNLNQLKRVREGNSNGKILEEYSYDENGNRIKKLEIKGSGNITTYYISDNFIQVKNASGSYNEVYFYDGNTLIGKNTSAGIFYYHPDHLGSTNAISDKIANVIEFTTYDPFGKVISGGSDKQRSYTGKPLDAATNLLYLGARYYNPNGPWFTQPDSAIQDIYNSQDLNHYAYVRNNPYKYVDPDGKWSLEVGSVLGRGQGIFLAPPVGEVGVAGNIGGGIALSYYKQTGFEIGEFETKAIGSFVGDLSSVDIIAFNPTAQSIMDSAGGRITIEASSQVYSSLILGAEVETDPQKFIRNPDLSSRYREGDLTFKAGVGKGTGGGIYYSDTKVTPFYQSKGNKLYASNILKSQLVKSTKVGRLLNKIIDRSKEKDKVDEKKHD